MVKRLWKEEWDLEFPRPAGPWGHTKVHWSPVSQSPRSRPQRDIGQTVAILPKMVPRSPGFLMDPQVTLITHTDGVYKPSVHPLQTSLERDGSPRNTNTQQGTTTGSEPSQIHMALPMPELAKTGAKTLWQFIFSLLPITLKNHTLKTIPLKNLRRVTQNSQEKPELITCLPSV